MYTCGDNRATMYQVQDYVFVLLVCMHAFSNCHDTWMVLHNSDIVYKIRQHTLYYNGSTCTCTNSDV